MSTPSPTSTSIDLNRIFDIAGKAEKTKVKANFPKLLKALEESPYFFHILKPIRADNDSMILEFKQIRKDETSNSWLSMLSTLCESLGLTFHVLGDLEDDVDARYVITGIPVKGRHSPFAEPSPQPTVERVERPVEEVKKPPEPVSQTISISSLTEEPPPQPSARTWDSVQTSQAQAPSGMLTRRTEVVAKIFPSPRAQWVSIEDDRGARDMLPTRPPTLYEQLVKVKRARLYIEKDPVTGLSYIVGYEPKATLKPA